MKSHTMASLMQTKVRHALGVMLAISAIFAVVISTISMPGDRATAQVDDADAEVSKRAAAWFNSLTLDEAINAILGKEADADNGTDGRQYVDTDDPADINQAIEFIYDAWTKKSATQSFYDGLPASTSVASNSGLANHVAVKALVDGSTSGATELYAVGNQISSVQGIRAFQSVKLWWNHLDCTEARTVVGEDSDDLLNSIDDDNDSNTANVLESSSVCQFPAGTTVGGDATANAISYDSLSDKTQVNQVGNALLGLTNGGTYSASDNAMAKRWWGKLNGTQRAFALYGDALTLTTPTTNQGNTAVSVPRPLIASHGYDDITTSITFTVDVDGTFTELPMDAASKALVPEVKALINDRAMLIYGNGGTGGKYEGVDAWWNSIGCLENQISVGEDNEPVASTPGEFCVASFSSLAKTQDRNADPRTVSDRERAMTVGRALLNLADIPDSGAWWNTLNATQMVNVVYGDPLEMEGDPAAPKASEADRKAFQQMYANLGTVRVVASDLPDVMIADTSGLLTRQAVPTELFDHDNNTGTSQVPGYLAKDVVDAIATEIFDPPHGLYGAYRRQNNEAIVNNLDANISENVTNNQPDDDNEFDPPYQSVGDWWETLDCRVMRLAVGEDNDYPDIETAGLEPEDYKIETSIYCGHLPGAAKATNAANTLIQDAHDRVDVVGKALLARSEVGRPSFNVAVTGIPTITGTAKVGSMLTANPDAIKDGDGVGAFSYQWIRDGADISGATGSTYTLTAADANAMISVRVSFTDGERYPESTTSVGTSVVAGSLGRISKIEPAIRDIKLSGGGTVVLSLNVYGVQGDIDNSLGGTYSWSVNGTSIEGSGRELSYTAPSSPGTYNVKATLADGDCRPKDESNRVSACSAEFEVKVLRPSAPQPAPEAPVNPPGDIPSILADSEGNQYEVFTPVEGGTFSGDGYSITAASGAVPNGEFIGVRMSDDGAASNAGMTHQRYTLGGNMYGVHAVDSSSNAITSTELDDPATVCVPLPDELRSNISDLAVVAINGDDSLTILSARVRITTAGTMVCAGLSSLPASLAVGSAGAPAAIPTPTPEPTPEPPNTGGSAPASSATVLWALLLGIAVLTLGSVLVIVRRREGTRKS